jgi:hypothetical protein
LTTHEINTCKNIVTAITESIEEVGTLNKKELREYIDFIFEAEGRKYKHLIQMKERIYNKVLAERDLYIENLNTGELKRYKQYKDIANDLGVKQISVSGYFRNSSVLRDTYLFMAVDRIRG